LLSTKQKILKPISTFFHQTSVLILSHTLLILSFEISEIFKGFEIELKKLIADSVIFLSLLDLHHFKLNFSGI
jgi:hypothetical protein